MLPETQKNHGKEIVPGAAAEGGPVPEWILAATHWTSIFLICICILWFFGAPSYPVVTLCTRRNSSEVQRVEQLISFWETSYFNAKGSQAFENIHPKAPHIEDCELCSQEARASDNRGSGGGRPSWGSELGANDEEFELGGLLFNNSHTQQRFFPPWVEGSDEDNLPLTRRVQHDLWLHQHPKNCSDPELRFLVTSWVKSTGLGLGAQIVATAGMFAIALRDKRILVLKNFDRAMHQGCRGSDSYGSWSCYFVPETSEECRARAMELESSQDAWSKGVVTGMKNYSKDSKWIRVPGAWGKPWESMETFDVVDGEMVGRHKAMDRQWWRAQAVRYLTRFPSKYLCQLLNRARHHAFAREAAQVTLKTLPSVAWHPEETRVQLNQSPGAEEFLRSKPWIPRPLLSVHVRQGDKSREMEIFGFKAYMLLAEKVRHKVPHIKGIWLSTEMQNVVEESTSYTSWSFYFTNITRQSGETSMGDYERSLGVEQSTNNALVNLLLSTNCDYFVGVLGSTWSVLIDGLRTTGGKLKSGFLSVNKDRFW